MKKTKALIVIIAILCHIASIIVSGTAASAFRYEPEAWLLKRLNLFAGASLSTFNPDLGAKLDRQVGITLLLNFFGMRKEVEAQTKADVNAVLSAFTDQNQISQWARPYMAYAVKTGIIVGTSPSAIGPAKPLDGVSFAAMILRRLGYTVDRKAFSSSIRALYEKGGLNSAEVAYFDKPQLIKDDAVGMIYTTLYAFCPDGRTLAEKLAASGKITLEKAVSQRLVRYTNPGSIGPVRNASQPIQRPTLKEVAYYQILDAMLDASPQTRLTLNAFTDTAQEVFDLVEDCVRENPEVLYYSGCTYSSNGLLTLQYSKPADDTRTHGAQLKQKVDEIIKQVVKPGMTEYEKELALHDYLVNSCRYDVEGYEADLIRPESYSAYGALCLGTAVCEGYAEAMMLALSRSGVECSVVAGISKGEGHAWNLVRINGRHYHLDATWDDPLMADGSQILTHRYFNLSDKEMSLDHQWDASAYPACTDSEFNYYVYNKLAVKTYEEFKELVVGKVRSGEDYVSVKIMDFDASGFDVARAVQAACTILYKDCSYNFNDVQGIADLYFK